MKKRSIICAIATMVFILAGAAIPSLADDAATINLLTSGPWKISGQTYGGWSNVRIFNKDGTFQTVEHANQHGRWSISGNQIILDFGGTHKDTISLPLNPAGTVGADQHGNATTAVLQNPIPGTGAPAAAPQPGGAAGTPSPEAAAIDAIIKRGAWTTEGVFAALQAKLPPWKQSSKLRSDIALLRVKLVEEAARAPVASPEAYKAAVSLCDAWLGALAERDKFSEKLTKSPTGTADMADAKPVKPTDDQLEQEKLDAKTKKQSDAKQNAFFNDPLEKLWAQRSGELRPAIDLLFTKLGDLRSQPFQPSPATTPAP